jgi:NhaA family Na+:H+ antiporter
VIGPVSVYLALNHFIGSPELVRGWGIPTATDIAIAWLVARVVFGARHPAVSFLLLLAIVDDAIGLAIIALFYPNPLQPVAPLWLSLVGAGMGTASLLRRLRVRNYWPYLLLGGGASWAGLYGANLHPALALVFIVPFLPHPVKETAHLFEEDPRDVSTLATFEREWKVVVDFGLFFFGLANAGVELSSLGTGTWLVFDSLLVGKTAGIFLFGWVGGQLGFPLPDGMGLRHLLLAGLIAGIGFTVSLFIAGEAFTDPRLQAEARMGAILSVAISLVAIVTGRVLRIGRET